MNESYITAGDVIKRFLTGWIIVWLILILISVIRYSGCIMAAVAGGLWSLISAAMPILIIVYLLFHLLGSIFR